MSTIIAGTTNLFDAYDYNFQTVGSQDLYNAYPNKVGVSVTGSIARSGKNVTISNLTVDFPSCPYAISSVGLQNTMALSITIGGVTRTATNTFYVCANRNDSTKYHISADDSVGASVADIVLNDVIFENTTGSTTASWSINIECDGHANTVTGSVSLTLPAYTPPTFYGSVNDQTEKVVKMYGPVHSTQTTTTLSGDGAVTAFNLDTFKAYTGATWIADGSYITVTSNGTRYDIAGYLVDGGQQYFAQAVTWVNMQNYGFTMVQSAPLGTVDRVDISITTGNFTKTIQKFYGSVNGQTKLIYKEGV